MTGLVRPPTPAQRRVLSNVGPRGEVHGDPRTLDVLERRGLVVRAGHYGSFGCITPVGRSAAASLQSQPTPTESRTST